MVPHHANKKILDKNRIFRHFQRTSFLTQLRNSIHTMWNVKNHCDYSLQLLFIYSITITNIIFTHNMDQIAGLLYYIYNFYGILMKWEIPQNSQNKWKNTNFTVFLPPVIFRLFSLSYMLWQILPEAQIKNKIIGSPPLFQRKSSILVFILAFHEFSLWIFFMNFWPQMT